MARVIAIDGPSGAGKSTAAKALSEKIGFEYLDTGALYRAVALRLLYEEIDEQAPDRKIGEILEKTSISFTGGSILLDGVDVSREIRTPQVGHYSSVFSARKVVRDHLLEIQRSAAEGKDIIAEGRDMTTVVFPDAWKKFFITAGVEIRAQRRYAQLNEKSVPITMEGARQDVVNRDRRDSERTFAPLKKAHDAEVIDNSTLSQDDTITIMLGIINRE